MVITRPQLDRRLRPDPLLSPANTSAHEELYGSVKPTETKGLRAGMRTCRRAGDSCLHEASLPASVSSPEPWLTMGAKGRVKAGASMG